MSAAAGGAPALRAVAFDFDGVILESAAIKTEAFAALFADLPQHLPAILEHHLANLGVSRFRKFDWVYRELLGRPLDHEASRRLGERYSALVLERVLACPEVPGARALLERLRGVVPVFVVSATPHEELRLIVEHRALADLFTEVRGSPPGKASILRELLDHHALAPAELLMVGDGHSDYLAAEAVGCRFALRETGEQTELFAGIEVPTVPDLTALAPLVEEALA